MDVAIGLAFLFFLLSIVASSVQELIASALSWRARNLEDAIRNLLGDPRGGGGTEWGDRVRRQLSVLLTTARRDIDAGREAAERLYDDTMDRARGWYKRKAQYSVWAIGLLVAFGLNVSAFEVGSRLWKDDALRAAVVAKAQQAAEAPAGAQAPASADANALEQVAESVDEVEMLELPVGWGDANQPSSAMGWIGWSFGCLLTAAAVGLGAPFWFDALQRVAKLRAAGKAPGPDGGASRAGR